MNAQDYISSGLLEAYVLGSLDVSESEQVAGAICRFPEVAAEIAELETLLILSAEQEAVAPPADRQEAIWAAIQASGTNTANTANTVINLPPASDAIEKPAAKVIPFEGSSRLRSASWVRAAVWLALVGSIVTNYMLWSSRNNDREELVAYENRLTDVAANEHSLAILVKRYEAEAEMAAQPGMQPVAMRSTQPGHPMAATIYWNKAKSEAYVSVQKLPPPPAGMQYQLWAIAGGKPVSIGMLENEVAIRGGMQKVPNAVSDGQAFAVSLEKAGGNQTPTPDKIFLLGKMPAA